MSEEKEKVKCEHRVKCKKCHTALLVKKLRRKTSEAVKAEYDERDVVEIDEQKGLGDFQT